MSLEIEVCGPNRDLHSGNFGGAIHNPLQALCEIIAKLHDSSGRVAVPGFYNRVRQWSGKEREYMARSGPRNAEILKDAGVESGWGERDYSLHERTTIRPALTVNGVLSGYQGPGGKGIIPARALVKLSFRLVPDQNPNEVEHLFRKHMARITPPAVKCKVRTLSRAEPVLIDRCEPFLQAAFSAYRSVFETPPVLVRSGGTIPIVSTFQHALGTPAILMGFGLPEDRIHAPNENFLLPNFYRGIQTSIYFLSMASKIQHCCSRKAERELQLTT